VFFGWIIKIIGIFAEFERENIIERVSIALEKKAREGYILSSFNTVPYGYRRQLGQREITVAPEEAKVIKEIFNLYLHKHKSYNAISTELNLRGIPSSGNSKWGSYTVSYILSNPIYMGKVRYCLHDKERYFESEGKHEAIISEEIFLEVQSKIGKMKKNRRRPREDNYYCGTLMCAECGHKMTTRGQYRQTEEKEAYYGSYLCLGKKYVGCKTGTLSHKKVDIAFRDYIEGYDDFDETVTAKVQPQAVTDAPATVRAEYETMLTRLLKKEKDVAALYISDRIDFEQYTHMLEAIRTDKKSYADKIFELEGEEQLNTAFQKEDILSNFKANWDELTNMERMQFLQTYIQAVYVRREEDRQIKIKRLEFYKK
jgi:site-specific DNA recombinase